MVPLAGRLFIAAAWLGFSTVFMMSTSILCEMKLTAFAHWFDRKRIAAAGMIRRTIPYFRGRDRLLYGLLPRSGRYVVPIGEGRCELDFGNRYERASAVGLRGYNVIDDILNCLETGDCFCDCGANLGVIALAAASHTGPRGHVYAFEPAPSTFQRLAANFALSGSLQCPVELFQMAMGSANGTASLHVASQHGWSTLSDGACSAVRAMGEQIDAVVHVEMQTLDHFFLDTPGRRLPQVVKIDVEGWEEEVLIGAQRLLKQTPPRALIVEDNPRILAAMGRDFGRIDDILAENGYVRHTSQSLEDRVYVLH